MKRKEIVLRTCYMLVCTALCALATCSPSAGTSNGTGKSVSGGSASGSEWVRNGATACEKYLTPDVVAAIVSDPAGKSEQLDMHSCRAGSIYIYLKVADIDVFRSGLPLIAGAHLMTGVGDGAYWNEAGAMSAVKGHDRGCDISVIGTPTKIKGAALGEKLGEICNKLFALP